MKLLDKRGTVYEVLAEKPFPGDAIMSITDPAGETTTMLVGTYMARTNGRGFDGLQPASHSAHYPGGHDHDQGKHSHGGKKGGKSQDAGVWTRVTPEDKAKADWDAYHKDHLDTTPEWEGLDPSLRKSFIHDDKTVCLQRTTADGRTLTVQGSNDLPYLESRLKTVAGYVDDLDLDMPNDEDVTVFIHAMEPHVNGQAIVGRGDIELNASLMSWDKPGSPDWVTAARLEAVAHGDTVRGVLAHEWGHTLDNDLLSREAVHAMLYKRSRELGQSVPENLDHIWKEVPEYPRSMSPEWRGTPEVLRRSYGETTEDFDRAAVELWAEAVAEVHLSKGYGHPPAPWAAAMTEGFLPKRKTAAAGPPEVSVIIEGVDGPHWATEDELTPWIRSRLVLAGMLPLEALQAAATAAFTQNDVEALLAHYPGGHDHDQAKHSHGGKSSKGGKLTFARTPDEMLAVLDGAGIMDMTDAELRTANNVSWALDARGRSDDRMLRLIAQQQQFDGPAKVVNEAQLMTDIAKGDVVEGWRGVQQTAHMGYAAALTDGDYFASTGVASVNGMFISTPLTPGTEPGWSPATKSFHEPRADAAAATAFYAKRDPYSRALTPAEQKQFEGDPNGFEYGAGVVAHVGIDAKARIVKYGDLLDAHHDFRVEVSNQIGVANRDGDFKRAKRLERLRDVAENHGRFAAMLGHEVIDMEGDSAGAPHEMIVLNRRALRTSRQVLPIEGVEGGEWIGGPRPANIFVRPHVEEANKAAAVTFTQNDVEALLAHYPGGHDHNQSKHSHQHGKGADLPMKVAYGPIAADEFCDEGMEAGERKEMTGHALVEAIPPETWLTMPFITGGDELARMPRVGTRYEGGKIDPSTPNIGGATRAFGSSNNFTEVNEKLRAEGLDPRDLPIGVQFGSDPVAHVEAHNAIQRMRAKYGDDTPLPKLDAAMESTMMSDHEYVSYMTVGSSETVQERITKELQAGTLTTERFRGHLMAGDTVDTMMMYPEYGARSRMYPADDPRWVAEQAVPQVIHQWATSSNDANASMLATQEIVAEKFAMTGHMTWDTSGGVRIPGEQSLLDTRIAEYRQNYGTQTRAVIDAQYDATQKMFADAGVTHVDAYRGWTPKVGDTSPGTHGPIVSSGQGMDDSAWQRLDGHEGAEVMLRPISSFSFSSHTGIGFSGNEPGKSYVVATRIPVEHILSTPKTGYGCNNEQELVVIGSKVDAQAVYVRLPRGNTPTAIMDDDAFGVHHSPAGPPLSPQAEKNIAKLDDLVVGSKQTGDDLGLSPDAAKELIDWMQKP